MSTQILNLTPHEINIGTASIKPFGVVARSDVFYPCCMVRDTQGRVIGCYNYLHDVIDGKIKPTKMTEAKAETKPLTLQSATTLAAPPIAPTIPITKTNTVSCSATKTCAAYKPVPQSPAKP